MPNHSFSSFDVRIGCAGLLTLGFVALKFGGAIAWPWLWVLAPLWGYSGAAASVVLFCFAAYAIVEVGKR